MKKRPSLAERLAQEAIRFSGSTSAFVVAFFIVIGWLASGYLFGFSDTWQLVI
ncbi:MAG: low affinity iron permease family protein, partial [Bacteroidota bacterium]